MSKQPVLVTGAAGFIGSFLVENLVDKGYRVRCLLLPQESDAYLRQLPVEIVRGDVRRRETLAPAIKGVQRVFHLAGVVKGIRMRDFTSVNVDGVINLLETLLEVNPSVKRVVFISSQAAAGTAPAPDKPVCEGDVCRPVSFYGRSKYLAEQAASAYCSRLPVTIIRPASVYGPRDREIYAFFRSVVRSRIKPLLAGGKNGMSFIYVSDLVDGLVKAGFHRATAGKTYYLSGDGVYSWRETADLIERIAGVKALTFKIPAFLAKIAGSWNDLLARLSGKPRMLSSTKIWEALDGSWVCSNQLAKREFGFAPRYDLESGFRATYAWYREQGWL